MARRLGRQCRCRCRCHSRLKVRLQRNPDFDTTISTTIFHHPDLLPLPSLPSALPHRFTASQKQVCVYGVQPDKFYLTWALLLRGKVIRDAIFIATVHHHLRGPSLAFQPRPVGVTTLPPWPTKITVARRQSNLRPIRRTTILKRSIPTRDPRRTSLHLIRQSLPRLGAHYPEDRRLLPTIITKALSPSPFMTPLPMSLTRRAVPPPSCRQTK